MSYQGYTDTHVHPADTDEHEVLVLPGSPQSPVVSQVVALFVGEATQNLEARYYYKNPATAAWDLAWPPFAWAPADPAKIILVQIYDVAVVDVRVTLQSAVAEGAPIDVPYAVGYGQ